MIQAVFQKNFGEIAARFQRFGDYRLGYILFEHGDPPCFFYNQGMKISLSYQVL